MMRVFVLLGKQWLYKVGIIALGNLGISEKYEKL